MASPDHFAELREKTRRIYALSFWGIAVPARLRNLEICLRNVFDLLTDVQKFFTSNGATQSEIEETYCSVLIGLSEDLDRFQSALSRWIDDPRKLEDTDSREIRQHMIESLPSREVIQRAHETLFLYSYLLGKVVENDRVDQQTHTHRTIPSGPRLRELAEDSLQGWPSLPISQRQQRFLHLRQDVDGNEYGRLIGMKLKLKMNNALREGHSSHTGSRTKLQLAAYWLMKVRLPRDPVYNCSSVADAEAFFYSQRTR
ncbi:hypothetical protein BJ170DRAFT_310994 [Xylariales sp. AK1849]|nr:hypothetical protein BJ170DRAFT_310994 [Xylariales sp. AK1849]